MLCMRKFWENFAINNMNKLKILIIGSEGREHAIGWKVAQSSCAEDIFFEGMQYRKDIGKSTS